MLYAVPTPSAASALGGVLGRGHADDAAAGELAPQVGPGSRRPRRPGHRGARQPTCGQARPKRTARPRRRARPGRAVRQAPQVSRRGRQPRPRRQWPGRRAPRPLRAVAPRPRAGGAWCTGRGRAGCRRCARPRAAAPAVSGPARALPGTPRRCNPPPGHTVPDGMDCNRGWRVADARLQQLSQPTFQVVHRGPPLHEVDQMRIAAQPGHRLRHRRLDRASRAAQNLRDLGLGQIIEQTQDNNRPLPLRQRGQHAPQSHSRGHVSSHVARCGLVQSLVNSHAVRCSARSRASMNCAKPSASPLTAPPVCLARRTIRLLDHLNRFSGRLLFFQRA